MAVLFGEQSRSNRRGSHASGARAADVEAEFEWELCPVVVDCGADVVSWELEVYGS